MSEDHTSCWVYKDLTVTTKQIQALLTAARASDRKGECQVRLAGIEREYWMGTEMGRLGGYGFRGTVTAGDGSNQKGGKIGAWYVNLQKQRKTQQSKVRREVKGSSSNRLELAAFVLEFSGTPMTSPMLYLCDNQAMLKAVKRWVEIDVSRSARRRHFTRSNQRTPKKNNRKSRDISCQGESASRRTCK